MEERVNAIKIAVVEEQIKGIRDQQAAHAKDTRERFEANAKENREHFDSIRGKQDELLAALNKGRGAYAVLFLLSGIIGALIIKTAGFMIQWLKP